MRWCEGAEAQRRMEETAAELQQEYGSRLARRNAAKYVTAWREYATQRRLISQATDQRHTQQQMDAVNSWHWYSHRVSLLRSHHNSLWVSHHTSLLRSSFVEWHTKSVWRSHFDRLCSILERLHGLRVVTQWRSAALTTAVQTCIAERHANKIEEAMQIWARFITQRKKIRRAKNAIKLSIVMRLQHQYLSRWCETRMKVSRYHTLSHHHTRLVLHDYYIAWRECHVLSRDVRHRDSDFTRVITLRRLTSAWERWGRHKRVRELERRVMERTMKNALQHWCRLSYMKNVYEKHICKSVWNGWMQYVNM